MNFVVERYSFLLIRDNLEVPSLMLPLGYNIRHFSEGIDEEIYCEIRNSAFAKIRGSETPITASMVTKMIQEEDYLEGGIQFLFHNEKAIGLIRAAADVHEDDPILNIGPLALLPAYQGKGLGRLLLRAGLQFGKKTEFNRAILCVDGENDRAKALYLQEGFRDLEGWVCYRYVIKSK